MKKILLPLVLLLSVLSVSAQYIHLQEDFNDTIMPAGWTTTAVTGSATWSFGIDGALNIPGINNLDGTPFAYFDDDVLGAGQTNNTAQLVTPTFDNSAYSITTLEFDYNFRNFPSSSAGNSFDVQVFNGLSWQTVFSQNIDDCGNYVGACVGNFPTANIDISGYANSNCQIRFTYFDGNDWSWHVGVDNVIVYSSYGQDIGVSEIVNLKGRCLSNQESVQAKIKNYGTDTISNFIVTLDINQGAQQLIDTVSTQLLPFDSLIHTFSSFADLSGIGSSYQMVSYTTLPLDSIISNDTLTTVLIDGQKQAPFFDDFEGVDNWVFGGPNSTWAIDSPAASILNMAYSGVKAMGTNPKGDYKNYELSYATSPCFILNPDSISVPIVEFKHNYRMGLYTDSLEIEYTVNDSTWNRLEANILPENWYDVNTSWKFNSGGWLNTKNVLSHLRNQSKLKFRFKFQSDWIFTWDGVLIDDFAVRMSDSVDLSLKTITSPSTAALNRCNAALESIVVLAENEGHYPIDSIFFFYQVDGGLVFEDTIVKGLQPFTRDSFVLRPKYDFSAVKQYTLNIWAKVNGDIRPSGDSILNYTVRKDLNRNVVNPGYIENFANFIDGQCTGVLNTFDTLRNGWTELSPANYNWHVQDVIACNGTNTPSTGPSTDHSGDGMIMYTEASNLNNVRDALLESPCVDFENYVNPSMRFWYHRYGVDMGNLYIDVFSNGVWFLGIDSLIGQSHNSSSANWLRKDVNLNQFSGQIVTVRFRATRGPGPYGDMAIDDIEFYSAIRTDAKMEDLQLQNPSCNSDTAALAILVNNFGADSIQLTDLKVYFEVNGGAVQIDSNAVAIASDSSLLFQVTARGLTSGRDVITAWVELPLDSNNYNDTLRISYSPVYDTLNYTEGFENLVPSNGFCGNYNPQLNLGWQVDLNDQWVAGHDIICSYGTSGATPTSSTGPDSAYAGNGFMYFEPGFNSLLDTANLTSGCFDLRNDSISYLDFYYHMYGIGTGKLYVDVLANGVQTRLDSIIGQQHFSATDPWSLKTINLNQFAGDIIRIRFTAIESANTSISDQGAISIDNVRISNSFPVTVLDIENSAQTLQLFPNPTAGEFTIRGNGYSTSELVLTVMDLNGRVIESRVINPASNSINERFDLSNQANGVYFISIQSEGKVEVKKVVLSGR